MSDAELWQRVNSDVGFRAEIAALTLRFLHRKIGNCNNRYFEECRNLNLLTQNRIMKQEACKYQLKSGALLIDPDDPTKNCTKFNLTNELAEYHLRRNPNCARLFAFIPPKEEVEQVEVKKDNIKRPTYVQKKKRR